MKKHLTDKRLFLAVSAFLAVCSLGFAFIAQYGQGITPCILCLYERYVYAALLGVGIVSLLHQKQIYFYLALSVIVIGILLGGYHLGVEWHFWQGTKACMGINTPDTSFEDFQAALMRKPIARCDQVSWIILGISATVWNLLFWLGLGVYWLICYRSPQKNSQ